MPMIRAFAATIISVTLAVGAGSCSALSEGLGSSTSSPSPVVEQTPGADPTPAAPAQQTIVPDVIGMDAEQARDLIELMGLEVNIDAGRMVIIKSNWTVISSDPAPEVEVEIGSTVTINVEKTSDVAPKETTLTKTDVGLSRPTALLTCKKVGADRYPYGFKTKPLSGQIKVTHEAILVDVEVEITNEFNATRTANMECTVSGSEPQPKLDDFLVY